MQKKKERKKERGLLLVPGFHVTHDASDAVITGSENRDRSRSLDPGKRRSQLKQEH